MEKTTTQGFKTKNLDFEHVDVENRKPIMNLILLYEPDIEKQTVDETIAMSWCIFCYE